jgi:hypothetical protein
MSNLIAQNRLAFVQDWSGTEGAWSGGGSLIGLALPALLPGGAEVVRRMASQNFRGSHDKAQIAGQGCRSNIRP